MKSFLLCNLCWTACKPNTRIMANSECHPNTKHIWCEKCVRKFEQYGSCVCKICGKRSDLNCLFDIKNTNPRNFDMNQLMGFSPDIILQIAQNAILFWDYQKSLQFQKSKSQIAQNAKKLKALTQKHQSEQLKHQNDINLTTQKLHKMKSAAVKYSNGFKKMQRNCKKLQNDLGEKTRQFNIMKTKYKELLHKHKRKSHSPNRSSLQSLGTISSNNISHTSRSPHYQQNKRNGNNLGTQQSIIAETEIGNNHYGRHQVARYHHHHSQQPQQRQQTQRRHSSRSENNMRTSYNNNALLPSVPKKDMRTNTRNSELFDAESMNQSPSSMLSGVSGLKTFSGLNDSQAPSFFNHSPFKSATDFAYNDLPFS